MEENGNQVYLYSDEMVGAHGGFFAAPSLG